MLSCLVFRCQQGVRNCKWLGLFQVHSDRGLSFIAQQYLTGKISLELTPQGSLAERCRAAGQFCTHCCTRFNTLTETSFDCKQVPAWPPFTLLQVTAQQCKQATLSKNTTQTAQLQFPDSQEKQENSTAKVTFSNALSRATLPSSESGRPTLTATAFSGELPSKRKTSTAAIQEPLIRLLLNCRYSAQNFSGAMARSARCTIVEADEIVPVGVRASSLQDELWSYHPADSALHPHRALTLTTFTFLASL